MPHRLLVDTSVWFDLAADHREQPVIEALEDLIRSGEIELVVPQQVLDEFRRNKDRVAATAAKSLQSQLRLVRQAVSRFSDEGRKHATLEALADLDRTIILKGETAHDAMTRIEGLISAVEPLPLTDEIRQRVTDRALAQKAPFHTGKNSVGDAILLEHYRDLLPTLADFENGCGFVTHNYKDFGAVDGDQRLPHPDIAELFKAHRSTYYPSMLRAIQHTDPVALADRDWEFNASQEPRRLSEILDAESRLFRQVWYNRHWNLRAKIDGGEIAVVPDADYGRKKHAEQIMQSVWQGALTAAQRAEVEVGPDNLGPWSDFEWGMLNGKLSALRWVMGDEWDMLDT